MMYQELRQGDIPCLSFMKNTNYVMYVGPELTQKELAKLHSLDIGVPVIYLPEVVQGISKEAFEYNFPGISWPGEISAELIYNQIKSELGEHLITPESRLLLKFDGEVLVVFDAKGSFDLAISYIINKCERKPQVKIDLADIRCCKRGGLDLMSLFESEELYKRLEDCEEELNDEEDDDIRFRIAPSQSIEDFELNEDSVCECRRDIVEEEFEYMMDVAAEEVRDAIKQLLLKGFSASIIRSWLDEDVKLSRLRITKQYKILLVDYDKEIKMGPLPKTVFLFFLRHPEGVRFSYLQDHIKELKMIYERVCKNDDLAKMQESIERLINPFDNSICEKCAAIKKAFLLNISDEVAKNYYINGAQGEKKGISLDRNLVEWECEL